MQPDHVRRHPDGSIDYGFYRRRAVRLRSEKMRKSVRGMTPMIKPLIAIALLIGTLIAMPTRAPQLATPAADVAAAAGGDAFRAN
jgi:hypothetical protein